MLGCCPGIARSPEEMHIFSCSRAHDSSDFDPYQMFCDQHVPALEGNCPLSKIECIGPERVGGMHRLNHAANRVYAILHLWFSDC